MIFLTQDSQYLAGKTVCSECYKGEIVLFSKATKQGIPSGLPRTAANQSPVFTRRMLNLSYSSEHTNNIKAMHEQCLWEQLF